MAREEATTMIDIPKQARLVVVIARSFARLAIPHDHIVIEETILRVQEFVSADGDVLVEIHIGRAAGVVLAVCTPGRERSAPFGPTVLPRAIATAIFIYLTGCSTALGVPLTVPGHT